MTWMSKIKEVRYKPRKHVSLNLEHGRHLARLRRCRRRAYAPLSNAVSHEKHEKFLTPYIGMGLRLAALPTGGAPLQFRVTQHILDGVISSNAAIFVV